MPDVLSTYGFRNLNYERNGFDLSKSYPVEEKLLISALLLIMNDTTEQRKSKYCPELYK